MSNEIQIRRGTLADAYSTFLIFENTLADLLKRFGSNQETSAADPDALAGMWARRRLQYEYLSQEAAQFWVAVKDGEIVGYSRSVLNDGLQELTEIFVLPAGQSTGVGRELMERAFPTEGVRRRSIIATTDLRAQRLYLKNKVYPRFPIYYFGRSPQSVEIKTDLEMIPLGNSEAEREAVARIDLEIIEHRRDKNHAWLAKDRQGFLYKRNGEVVGYGYTGVQNGPFALLNEADFPAVLAHAEQQAVGHHDHFGMEVPIVNQTAVNYLLEQGFEMDSFVAIAMSDQPFGKFSNYIATSPPFFW